MSTDDRGTTGRATDSKIDHPRHYNSHASGLEAIDVCELLGFDLGNAVKYLMRAPHKGSELDDVRKARWYVARALDHAGTVPIVPYTTTERLDRVIAHEGSYDCRCALEAIRDSVWSMGGGPPSLAYALEAIDRMLARLAGGETVQR